MNYIKYIFLTIITLHTVIPGFSQVKSVSSDEEKIITSALKDEMKRAYDSLRKTDYENPFFISYTLLWGNRYVCSAKMGVIYDDKTLPLREATMRMMVGGYDMNDENFEPSNFNREPLGYTKSFVLPADADYYAIRRHYWQMSEDVYRSANELYKLKKAAVEKKGGIYQADGLKDFSPVEPQVYKETPQTVDIKLDSVRKAVQKISEVFDNDTLITDADVTFSIYNVMNYTINTEGSELFRSYQVAEIGISVSSRDELGVPVGNSLNFTESDFRKLPDEAGLIEACKHLKERTLSESFSDTIPEDYTGPIMILEGATADYFETYLFSGDNALIAGRESFKEENIKQAVKENKSDEQKYNKRIFSRDLNVMDCSGLSEYKGIKLAGHYKLDTEGVNPIDSLVLVKDGIIKNMLNNRVPTPMQRTPNGHAKYPGLSTSHSISPGVLVVTSNTITSRDEMKKKLLAEAEDRNLEYAYILKPYILAGKYCGRRLYRIDVATGTEKIINHGFFTSGGYDQTKPERILAMSGDLFVHNTYFKSINENPTTYIVPDAILIELSDISFDSGSDIEIRKPFVPYPPFE